MKKYYESAGDVFDNLAGAEARARRRQVPLSTIKEISQEEFFEIANNAMALAEARSHAPAVRVEPGYTQDNFGVYDQGWPRKR